MLANVIGVNIEVGGRGRGEIRPNLDVYFNTPFFIQNYASEKVLPTYFVVGCRSVLQICEFQDLLALSLDQIKWIWELWSLYFSGFGDLWVDISIYLHVNDTKTRGYNVDS